MSDKKIINRRKSWKYFPAVNTSFLIRSELIKKIAAPGTKVTFIHAGPGYGKTTLLSQYAASRSETDCLFLSIQAEHNIELSFLDLLENSLKNIREDAEFSLNELIPFSRKYNFFDKVLESFLVSIGQDELILIFDDVHLIVNHRIIDFFTKLVTYAPENLTIIMAGRHAMWSSFFRLKMDGIITEIVEQDLAFSPEETEKIWGFFDQEAYHVTEGWILAIQSYRLIAEHNKKIKVVYRDSNKELFRYLLDNIIKKLPEDVQFFLKATSGFPYLDSSFCDSLLEIGNSKEILESLIEKNVFTIRVSEDTYRYHHLFHRFLQKNDDGLGREFLNKAMNLLYENKQYEKAAEYALLLNNQEVVHNCISAIIKDPFCMVHYRHLKKYFTFLDQCLAPVTPIITLAKGLYLSDKGNFVEAEKCLTDGIRGLDENHIIYLHAMAHKARVLRNMDSFEKSNQCIESLLPLSDQVSMEDQYVVMIEKIHNLAHMSELSAAHQLTDVMIEKSLQQGSRRVKRWFERYLTVIYFLKGDYRNCIVYYEKSLSIPEEEQNWLMRHSVGGYAAKAYQIAGQKHAPIPLLDKELDRLNQLGLHEELGIIFLLYAEILHADQLLRLYRGEQTDFSEVTKYVLLAEEYSLLYRSTRDLWLITQGWKMCSGLLLEPQKAQQTIGKLTELIEEITPFFRSVMYGRLANAIDTLRINPEYSLELFKKSIETGESVGSYAYSTLAYGRMAAMFLQQGNHDAAREYTKIFLELACKYDHIFYLHFEALFAAVLKFAIESDICADFAKTILSTGREKRKKIHVHSLGRFYITPFEDKENRIKIRTQKARELLAYMLENHKGVTKDRILHDLWRDSDADVSSMFHTRRGEIRQAFEKAGAANPITKDKGQYCLDMSEIDWDYQSFCVLAESFMENPSVESAKMVIDLYDGRYLDDLEALWAEGNRINSEDLFMKAAHFLIVDYEKKGYKKEKMDLLNKCRGLINYDHLFDNNRH